MSGSYKGCSSDVRSSQRRCQSGAKESTGSRSQHFNCRVQRSSEKVLSITRRECWWNFEMTSRVVIKVFHTALVLYRFSTLHNFSTSNTSIVLQRSPFDRERSKISADGRFHVVNR